MRMLKRPMTLDLDSAKCSKKQRATSLLTSPDLNMLKLASPELERLIIAQHGMVTTTPAPNQCMYPKNTHDDQEQYARGFADALTEIPAVNNNNTTAMYPPHQQSMPNDMNQAIAVSSSNHSSCSVMAPSTSAASAMGPNFASYSATTTATGPTAVQAAPVTSAAMANCYASVTNGYYGMPAAVKEEPQTVPTCMGVTTPPLSPIDMEDQERIKLERKRLRNRIAASKCRRRKLERIARLEDKVALLKSENAELSNVVTTLREQVCQLKQQVMDHVRCGCEILINSY